MFNGFVLYKIEDHFKNNEVPLHLKKNFKMLYDSKTLLTFFCFFFLTEQGIKISFPWETIPITINVFPYNYIIIKNF